MDNQMYGQNQNGMPGGDPYASYYEAPTQRMAGPELEEPVSLGDWLVSMILMWIPCVNVVMMFIWAFSRTEKKSKSNFFKASLIMSGISIVLAIVMVILMTAGMAAAL